MTHHDDDPLAARLRAALTSEADMVNPSDDGLQRIRIGAGSARRSWWNHPAAPALAAAAVLGLAAGAFAVALGGDGQDGKVVAGQTGTSTAPEPTSPSPTTSAAESGTPSPIPVEGPVYVYYARDDDGQQRLYREERPGTGASPVAAALSVMLAEPAEDPDYTSLWPQGTELDDVQVSGDVATVSLSGFPDLGPAAESAAVQQLVHTVTANDKSVREVELLVDGAPPSGKSDWSEPVARAPMVDVQGFVWLLGPTEGSTVSSPVAVTGVGTAFEGTVSWDVRREGSDAVVAEGFTQAGANGEFDEFRDSVTLDPGTYEIRAFESSAEDGSPRHVDSKTFRVG